MVDILPQKPGTIIGRVPRSAATGPRLTPMELAAITSQQKMVIPAIIKPQADAVAAAAADPSTYPPLEQPKLEPQRVRGFDELSPDELAQLQQHMTRFDQIAKQIEETPPAPVAAPAPEPELEISEEDRLEFAACFLSEELFAKEYRLFGDTLVVTFSELEAEEQHLIDAALEQDYRGGLLSTAAGKAKQSREYGMACALMELTLNDMQTEIAAKPKDVHARAAAVRAVVVKAVMYEGLLRAYDNFKALCEQLAREAEDPRFFDRARPST
jgi:hypothetical protein